MSNKAGKRLVPELRFPEFREAGEWREGQLTTLSNEPLSNGVFNDPKKVGVGYKLINVSDMYIDTAIDEGRLSLLELSPSNFEANQVKHGDIFFTRSSLVKSGIAVSNIYLGNSSNVTFDGHLIRFRANAKKAAPLFAHYLFKTTAIRAQLVARGKSATMTTIGQKDVASVMLSYPDKVEQQKIADCLSSLDDLIVAQAKKIEALKAHKKGMVQQLFPAEGETVPRLRFPEFLGKNTETSPLRGIVRFSSGGTPSKDEASYWNGDIPWISASSMYDENISDSECKVTPLAIGNGTRIAPKGSLLILVRGSMLFNRVPMGIAVTDVAFNQDVKALSVCNSVDASFLLFQLLALSKRIPINETGIGAGKIESNVLAELPIYLPSIIEQKKVAKCLSSLGVIITAQTKKLATLKTLKQGLMQGLFPSASEVEA